MQLLNLLIDLISLLFFTVFAEVLEGVIRRKELGLKRLRIGFSSLPEYVDPRRDEVKIMFVSCLNALLITMSSIEYRSHLVFLAYFSYVIGIRFISLRPVTRVQFLETVSQGSFSLSSGLLLIVVASISAETGLSVYWFLLNFVALVGIGSLVLVLDLCQGVENKGRLAPSLAIASVLQVYFISLAFGFSPSFFGVSVAYLGLRIGLSTLVLRVTSNTRLSSRIRTSFAFAVSILVIVRSVTGGLE